MVYWPLVQNLGGCLDFFFLLLIMFKPVTLFRKSQLDAWCGPLYLSYH